MRSIAARGAAVLAGDSKQLSEQRMGLSEQRQMPDADATFGHRHNGAFRERILRSLQNFHQQSSQFLGPQPFNPDPNHRWPGHPCQSQARVEVGIQCNYHHAFRTSQIQDFVVRCGRQAYLADVDRLNPGIS